MIPKERNHRNPEIIAGIFALLTGISVVATLLSRIEFLSHFSSLQDDIEYMNENLVLLKLNSIIWFISALFLTLSASALIVAFHPHEPMLAFLQGFFLVLASAMFCMSGIKGFTIIDLMGHYLEPDLKVAEAIRLSVFSLSREKEIFATASYALIGLSFLMIGLFALVTRKISIVTGIIGMATGISLPLFSSLIPKSIFASVGIAVACILFFILSYRLLFMGLTKKEKPKHID
ncbi:MAG: hypothetical protein H6539_03085 [Bacteroidales bacterium]|nr:hypothetical protein [Bacteroidales bacterium]